MLVIDDELHARELMTRHLRKAGVQVVLASNGQEGLALVRQQKPVAIILDVVMPENDLHSTNKNAIFKCPLLADSCLLLLSLLTSAFSMKETVCFPA